MACYSDHNEDIRAKGSCDFCGSTRFDPLPCGHPGSLQALLDGCWECYVATWGVL